jgi:hypothetical protein
MITRWVGFLSVILLFLICTATAVVPDMPVGINSTKSDGWFVANGIDSGTITVDIRNNTTPVNGMQVTFSVNNSLLGSVNPVTVNTANGKAATTFSVLKKSGNILIKASIRYKINDSDTNEQYKYLDISLPQKIDHDTPYRIGTYNFSNEMTVATINTVKLGFFDRWDNPVDNKRVAEQVKFSVSSPPPHDGGFWDGYHWMNTTTVSMDATGNASIAMRVNSEPGWNIIVVQPLMETPDHKPAIADKYLWIEGIPGVPWTIEAIIDPPSHQTYADGVSKIHISYLLKDQFGNNVMNRSVFVETSIPGEEKIVGTNAEGLAMLNYGPKSSIGRVWINATALDNSSVQSHEIVQFISQEASDILLTANPQTMPSRDANPGFSADLMARVVDILGNPVPNINVTFAIDTSSIRYDEPNYSITQSPGLSSYEAVTDEDGYAIVQFLPGAFTTNYSDTQHYDPTATGRVNATATWEDTTKSIQLVWKNYPYLSVETYTSRSQVQLNDTVDITVMLKGDGWALQPDPIDAMLCIDRSGSMLYDNPDRMYSIRQAAKVFVDKMSFSKDRVGLATFGRNGYISRPGYNSGISTSEINNVYIYPRTYSGYATIDRTLSTNFTDVKSELDKIVPDYGTPMRDSIKTSISHVATNGRSKAVRAVIILSDGDYNWYGDPLARGTSHTDWDATDFGDLTTNYYKYTDLNTTNQNMSNYAKNSGVKIYSIAFASTISTGGKTTLKTLAEGSGGKYYEASATNIADVYTAIAGDLKQEAGVNTGMNLKYDQVEVNYALESNTGTDPVLSYVYAPGYSTWVNSYFLNGSVPAHSPSYPYVFDQTSDWNGNPRKLNFNVGTIYLNQVWETKYRLKVEQEGNINIFGPDSTITFNNGAATLALPKTYVSGIRNLTNTSVTTNVLKYTSITQEDPGSGGGPEAQLFITFHINSIYTGTMNLKEQYYIITNDQHKYLVGTRILTPAEASQLRTFRMRVADLPAGWVEFLPVVNVEDAPGPERPVNPPSIVPPTTSPGRVYIQLN